MAAKNTFIWGDISDRIIGSMQTLCTVDIEEGMWGQCTKNITKCIAVQLYLMLSGVILWKLKIPSSAESLQISRPCSRQAETQKIRVLSPVLFKSRNWKVSRVSEIVSPNWICLKFLPPLRSHYEHACETSWYKFPAFAKEKQHNISILCFDTFWISITSSPQSGLLVVDDESTPSIQNLKASLKYWEL